MTAILAVTFFVTSMGLSLIARFDDSPASILDRVSQPASQDGGADAPATGGNGVLDSLEAMGNDAPEPTGPAVPQSQ
jgi:preprotein translocase subunit SecG